MAGLLLAASPSIIVGQRDSIVSDSLLGLTVDLSLQGVSLEVALDLLAEGSGLTIEISTDVAGDTGAVSCACMGVTVRQALDSLLAGTSLFYEVRGDHVTVKTKPRS